jgi:hypothetical protein
VIIAVSIAGMVEMAVHQVIGVVAVRDGFMPAVGTVHMRFLMTAAVVSRGAEGRVIAADGDAVLLYASLTGVVQMAVMQIIGMTLVLHRRMAAVGAVSVGVAIVNILSCHD